MPLSPLYPLNLACTPALSVSRSTSSSPRLKSEFLPPIALKYMLSLSLEKLLYLTRLLFYFKVSPSDQSLSCHS